MSINNKQSDVAGFSNLQQRIKKLQEEIKDLKEENKKYKDRKAYGLVWENEKNYKEKIVEDCKKKLPILERVKEKEIITDESLPMNLMIEGDNYHALTCLNYTHKGKIDVIYIDPPYNTGSKDWKYNNDYVDNEDRFRHSKWLNMMYSRLSIAKNLLAETGFLICSIDHHELFNLGLLCDSIYGEKNRLGIVTILHNPKGRNLSKFLSENSEYYLIYTNNFDNSAFNNVAISENVKRKFNLEDSSGRYRLENFIRARTESLKINKPKFWYPIYVSKDLKVITSKKKEGYFTVFPKTNNGDFAWKTIQATFDRNNNNNYFKADMNNDSKQIEIKHKYREKEILKNVWVDKKYHSEFHGTNLLKAIIGANQFSFPKSLHAVLDSLKITSKKNSIILDFFAGSGTTGHAVLELNKQDGGNRQFILCTNNEGNIAEEICYPRLKKVIQGYASKGSDKTTLYSKTIKNYTNLKNINFNEIEDIKKNNKDRFNKVSVKYTDGVLEVIGENTIEERKQGLDGNLHYFKADENSFISMASIRKVSDEKKLELTLHAGELIAIKENIFDQKGHTNHYQIFENSNKQVAIYFQEEKKELRSLLTKLDSKKEVIVYLFSWGKNTLGGDDFGFPNIIIKDIPQPIIEVYKEING